MLVYFNTCNFCSKRHILINDEKVKKYDVEENFSFSPSQKTEYVSN
jgi:hypothetical protein